MTVNWRSSLLSDDHDLNAFDCGVPELNSWLWNNARRAHEAKTARTHVWTTEDSNEVKAFYSLAPTQVIRDGLPTGYRGGYTTIPAYLIARLALDSTIQGQGQGLGTDLLLDALELVFKASRSAGGRLVVVDAMGAATAKFYKHHGFKPVKNDPLCLVMKVATVEKLFTTAAVRVHGDPELGLMALDVNTPDGTTSSSVLDVEEAQLVADRLNALVAARAHDPQIEINLRAELAAVLGRDVLG